MPHPPQLPTFPRRFAVSLVAVVVALAIAGPAAAALPAPEPAAPLDGEALDALPVFSWSSVAGADKYEFEIAADAGFNSPVLGGSLDHFFTRNTRATLLKTVPNSTYYWRVRAVDKNSVPGAWSATMSFGKEWATAPALQSPLEAGVLTFPADPFLLRWDPVEGAWNYRITVATSPDLSETVWSSGALQTQATAFDASDTLAPGTYYWGVTPLDPENNPGSPSEVRSFVWTWPSTTNTYVNELVDDVEIDDWELSWDMVPGAAKYEVEINSDDEWALSSRVCCYTGVGSTPQYALGTKITPTVSLPNNHYYWRVRAIDPSGNPGEWNHGPEFTKTYANVPPTTAPSVKNLRMRDNAGDPGTDLEGGTSEFDTNAPVVAWDPVPGASSYQVVVAPFNSSTTTVCDWAPAPSDQDEYWESFVTATAWTPLAGSWTGVKPFNDELTVSYDVLKNLVAGHSYCVRVRPIDQASNLQGTPIYGDWTYLPGGANDDGTPAFTFEGYPAGNACSPSCSSGYLGSDDYFEPLRGSSTDEMPLFTWDPIPGAQSYYVLVARDPSFTHMLDYALTRIPAYSPRTKNATRGYPDETTTYYWAILPALGANGSGSTGDPLLAAMSTFQKQSTPPDVVSPTGQEFRGPVTFRWTPVLGARYYVLQVSESPTFGTLLETATTDSSQYTSNTSYKADTLLYWRVRPYAENDGGRPNVVGLTFSQTGTFRKRLATPVLDPGNPAQGTAVPTWQWDPVAGAIDYDVEVEIPNGTNSTSTKKLFSGVPTTSFTLAAMKGTGVWKWRVRANFPTTTLTPKDGPWTATQQFIRTIPEPANPTHSASGGAVNFSWDPQPARLYRVQVSALPDFSRLVEQTATDNTSYAPNLMQSSYAGGGTFYWRVAPAANTTGNGGDYTATKAFTLQAPSSGGATLKRFRITSVGKLVRNKLRSITITVKNRANWKPVGNAMVSVYGAGITPKSRLTGSTGKVSFYLKPTRYGNATFRVSKAGFATAYHYKKVY